MEDFEDINVWFYTLSSEVNPTNSSNTWQFFLNQVTIPIQPHTHLDYIYDIAENVLHTDHSVFPWSETSTSHSLMADECEIFHQKHNLAHESSTTVAFQRSPRTYIYHR